MSFENRPNAIFIMGPTGTGKSRLALRLAEVYPIEIISVDSVQVYKDLNVGSAKPSRIHRKKVYHHLIDICELDETYSAARFCEDSRKASLEIGSRGKVPLFVGGTGLYFKSLLHGLSRLPKSDPNIRCQLEKDLQRVGLEELHKKLRALDPVAASRIHKRDTQRIIRALEVCVLSGDTITHLFDTKVQTDMLLKPLKFVLYMEDRNYLRERLRVRFMTMLGNGLINEIAFLRWKRNLTEMPAAFRSVGYRDVWGYLENRLDYPEMVSKAVIASSQLAKRQTTWFKRETNAIRCESSDDDTLFAKITEEIEKAEVF